MPGYLTIARALADRLEERVSGVWTERRFGRGAPVAWLDWLVPFLQIRTRQGTLIRLLPNEVQKRFARQRTERNIILKARQVGMTTYIAARFFLATLLRPGTVTLQVAHTLESAQRIFRIVHRFLTTLDEDVGRHVTTERANVRELAFAATDSRYIVDTAGNANAARGLTIHRLHASEVAQWPHRPEETMAALLAAVPPGGTVEVESTPHGAGGWFHQEWLRAENRQGGQGFTPHFFPWWLEPDYRITAGEELEPLEEDERLLMKREGLTVEQLRFRRHLRATFHDLAPQEYAENAVECFLASGRPVFDVKRIEARRREVPSPIRVSNNGAEQVWYEPQAGRSYIIGADVAEGSARGDFSAAVVIDADTGLQVAELLARWPLARFTAELNTLGRRFNAALLAVERNNHGHAILHALRSEHAYPELYAHPHGAGGQETKLGWPMNAQTKPQAVEALRGMLNAAPEVFSSTRLLDEMRSFVYHDSGEAGALAGTHDDLVIAAAIAYAVRARHGAPQLAALTL